MGKAKVTRKDKAYKLFSEGYEPSSPEVKALGLSKSSRYSYYSKWKTEGQPAPVIEEKSKGTEKEAKLTVKAKTGLPGGETIAPISEPFVEESKGREEEPSPTDEGIEEGEEKPKRAGKEGVEVPSDSKKKIPTSIVGEGLRVTVSLSVQTLALYQIAANAQAQHDGEEELTMGDFLDTCAEDFFRVRGKKLGLIQKAGGK